MSRRTLTTLLATSLLLAGCGGEAVLSEDTAAGEPPVWAGLYFIEDNLMRHGAISRCGQLDDEGRLDTAFPSDPDRWVHLIRDGYHCHKLPLDAYNKQLAEGPIRLPVDDSAADNPALREPQMVWSSDDLLLLSVEASDPDHDLSREVLHCDGATSAGAALNPPGPPDGDGNYPDGTYTVPTFRHELDRPGQSQLFFVAVDNLCNVSQIIETTYPTLP